MVASRRALVLTSQNHLGLSIVRALGSAGWKTWAAGSAPGRLIGWSRHCSGYRRLAETPEELGGADEAVLERVAAYAREVNAELVVPACVPGAMFVASLKPRLPGVAFFPSSEPKTLRMLDDKWAFVEFLKKHGLPGPRTRLVRGPGEIPDLPLPLIMKPLNELGGRGIVVARDAKDRDRHLAACAARGAFPLIAQEFIEGRNVVLDLLADRGRVLAWCVRVRENDGAFRFIEDEAVAALGRRIAEAAAYTGILDIDLRYDAASGGKPVIIECNPRFFGYYDYAASVGLDLLGLGLELAAGHASQAARRSPVGRCSGLLTMARRLFSGAWRVPATDRALLRRRLGDPVPELYRGIRMLLGSGEGGV